MRMQLQAALINGNSIQSCIDIVGHSSEVSGGIGGRQMGIQCANRTGSLSSLAWSEFVF
jgi:hypothetical protein